MNQIKLLLISAIIWIGAAACATTPPVAPTRVETPPPGALATPAATKTLEPTATPTLTPMPTEIKPIKIGLLSDQSSALRDYATMLENGFTFGFEYAMEGKSSIAGRALQIIVKDSAGKTDAGVQAARDLLEKDQVDILIAPPSASVAFAVSDLARQANKIVIHTTASPDVTGKYFHPYAFRAARATTQDTLAMALALTRAGKSFIQIASDNPAGQSAAASFYGAIKARGGRFVVNDTPDKFGATFIPAQARDLPPYFQIIVQPPLPEFKADVVIVSWAGAGFVNVYEQMRQVGVFKAATVAALIPDHQAIKVGFASAVGLVGVTNYQYALPQNKVNDWLVERHKAKFAAPPDVYAETGFTAAQMIVAALNATNGDPRADALAPALEKLSFDGVKGNYAVRASDHALLQTMYFAQVTNTNDATFKFLARLSEFKPDDIAPPCALEGDYKTRCAAR
ncbi:MAG: ABC transporter substrate-binding protein [Chloroflexi bacterium]|nr:ABC transporter substrate-binding protein [Chloroflexota bacterium]